ncbi:DNA repair protein-like protein [Hapsidospora chrysogenum ATCC 11550]|uniref:DNA repair protein RAD14 n=1 Tax=Hapsidospora chrysogenum (strain ATCC 11550 / CBS 779.69 / DSM 880 / IAM 14645 / JCM 23072 / IMI 49137) TaxID=857340 RepID=A0A086TGI9_HAPC1|nr:DNA repair protein-like protein [Hapsidospora chrysogenum ATCC 11550]
MEQRSTPPPRTATTRSQVTSPPTPEATRRIVRNDPARTAPALQPPGFSTNWTRVLQEESRLRAKAIRDQRESEQRASGTAPSIPKLAAGFIPTEDVHITKPVNGKRPHNAISTATVATPSSSSGGARGGGDHDSDPRTNRDGRNKGDEGALRPARKFTKFVDYNMSSMTDTKGGFLSTEDDPHNHALSGGAKNGPAADDQQRPKHMSVQEWERLQLIRSLKRNKAGPYEPGLSVLDDPEKRKRCRDCGSLEVDWVWEEVFHICVCNKCKEKFPDKYSLLTKTECKEDYLLTDPELRDPELLPHLSKPNPHKSHWHDMMLFLRCQVEEYALNTKWGSAEALDAEYERREAQKKARKEAKFKEKLLDLKRKTRTDAFRRQAGNMARTGASRFGDAVGGGGKHVHDWGRPVVNEEGMSVKSCVDCGMEVEELEL